MFKLTKSDLATKSDAQLTALFNEANISLAAANPELAVKQLLIAMIRAEIAARRPH